MKEHLERSDCSHLRFFDRPSGWRIVPIGVAMSVVCAALGLLGFMPDRFLLEVRTALVFGAYGAITTLPVISRLVWRRPLNATIGIVYGLAMPLSLLGGFLLGPGSFVTTWLVVVGGALLVRFSIPACRPWWQCQSCGYDLRGARAGLCPECGAGIDRGVQP